MTCVVGYVDETKIMHMAADSLVSDPTIKVQMKTKKIFQKDYMLCGFSGDIRAGQLLQYICKFPNMNKQPLNHIISDMIPAIQSCFSKNGYEIESEESFSFLVALEGTLFEIDHMFQVIPYEKNYAAIGSGVSYGTAYMYATENSSLGPRERLEGAIRCASEFCSAIGGRIDYLSLQF